MSKIQWTDQTANPIKEAKEVDGRLHPNGNYCIPVSPGCANCYASVLNARGTRFGGNGRKFGVRPNGHPEMWLDLPMLRRWERIKKPRRIFVGSMTDIFGEWVPDWMIYCMLDAMANSKATFQLLTKRPQRMSEIVCSWLRMNGRGMLPDNIWVGTSAENQQCYNERVLWLGRTLAQIRFLSLEPLLGPIDLARFRDLDIIHWVIIGGESGHNARPLELAWIEDVLKQCEDADIPAFVKQLGSRWDNAPHGKGGEPEQWPQHLRVRMFPGEIRA